MGNTASTGHEKSGWLKKIFVTVLAGVLLGGTVPVFGERTVHAEPVPVNPTEPQTVFVSAAGTGVQGSAEGPTAALSQIDTPTDLAVIELDGNGHLLVANDPGNKKIWLINSAGMTNGVNGRDYLTFQLKDNAGHILAARDIAYDSRKKVIYFTGSPANPSSSPKVFALDFSSGITENSVPLEVKTLIPGNDPDFAEPKGLDVSSVTGDVYTADYQNIGGFIISTGEQFSDVPVKRPDVEYNSLMAIQISSQIRWKYGIFAAQEGGGSFAKAYNEAGQASDFGGGGGFEGPALTGFEVALDPQYNLHAAYEFANVAARLTTLNNSLKAWKAVAGTGVRGMGALGQAPLATALNSPKGIAVAVDGTLYVSDSGNHRILKTGLPQDAPVSVTAQAGDSSAEVSWNAAADAASYDVYKHAGEAAPSSEADWQYAGQAISPQTSAKITGLANGQPYVFAVKAKGAQLYSVFSSPSNAVTPQSVPYVYEQEIVNGQTWNLVQSAADLDHMRDNLGLNYKLVRDLSDTDLDEYLIGKNGDTNWRPIGTSKEMFTGRFDGGSHAIDGLSITNRSGGLFGALDQAQIGYLNLTNLTIESFQRTGGLAASAYRSEIARVSVEGSIKGSSNVGGLIGFLGDSDVRQSFFKGSVRGIRHIGGLIGTAEFNATNGVHTVQDNYAWGSIAQTNLSVTSANEVSIQTTEWEHFAGFVGKVSSDVPSGDAMIFKNNYASIEASTPEGLGETSALWGFGGADIGQEPLPSESNYWNTKANAGALSPVIKAAALNDDEMKVMTNFANWDFDKIWIMDPVSGYPVLRALTNGQPTTPTDPTNPTNPTDPTNPVEPNPTNPPVTEPTTPTVPTIPSTGGSEPSTPVVTAPTPSNTTTINVNVQNDKTTNGSVVSTLAITRTKGTDGTTKDALQLTPAKAAEIINLLKTSGSKTAAIVLPDTNDEVSQWDLTVPNAASKVLTAEGVELVILNPNVRITVPASSLTNLTDDLYFRLIPVKSTSTSAEIQARALANPEIVATANGGNITVLGRPMTIETNLQSRPVTLTLPLPAGSTFTAAQQRKLGVYIEHSDGTKQLVPGKVVTGEDGKPGLELTVNHFSTFTIVNVSSWGGTLNAAPYILGYQNGSFKPEQDITRAELAAIVGRITGVTTGTAAFSDVKNGSWASTVAGPAAASGIMTGYSDGTFKPNASITRAELAAALAKLLPQSGLNTSASATGFRDLAAGHWVTEAAAQLQAAGVITGYADGSFKPEQAITRAEAVTMINRLIGLDASTTQPGAGEWTDVASAYWAHDAILAASMKR
ncbi:S-layer homology domain-containing protein [Saccharibacillus brassicae]|uniref:S-layer homology domain-containing protein n=2 Tax=Saccharibacillus TaxID=456492 RepID=UPI0039ED472F